MCLPYVLWLEKHILGHKDQTPARITRELSAAKRRVAVERLKALRATNPQPPMVSTLDLSEEEEDDDDDEEEQQAGRAGSCQKSACVNAKKRVQELEKQVKDLKKDCATLRVSEFQTHCNSQL